MLTAGPGATVDSVASDVNLPPAAVSAYNQLQPNATLQQGQTLSVPCGRILVLIAAQLGGNSSSSGMNSNNSTSSRGCTWLVHILSRLARSLCASELLSALTEKASVRSTVQHLANEHNRVKSVKSVVTYSAGQCIAPSGVIISKCSGEHGAWQYCSRWHSAVQ